MFFDFDKISKNFPAKLPAEPLRLFHGRGGTVAEFEFLSLDWYPPLILATLYERQDPARVERLGELLNTAFPVQLEAMIVQARGAERGARLVFGTVPEPCIIEEDGLRYRIDPLAEQNIGFFPDMKPGRQLVRTVAAGKRVLNLFAYTCSLSVAAVAGGATHVVNLDMNRNLLDRGRENHRLNGQDLRQVSFLAYNLFKSFGRLKKEGPFDLVIIDPPYQQGSSFRAERDWPKILKKLPDLLTPGGEIIAAVSAPELGRSFLDKMFAEHRPDTERLATLTAGRDFPEADPDKGLHIRHDRLQR